MGDAEEDEVVAQVRVVVGGAGPVAPSKEKDMVKDRPPRETALTTALLATRFLYSSRGSTAPIGPNASTGGDRFPLDRAPFNQYLHVHYRGANLRLSSRPKLKAARVCRQRCRAGSLDEVRDGTAAQGPCSPRAINFIVMYQKRMPKVKAMVMPLATNSGTRSVVMA
jgi:hypothetical protein